MTSPYESELDQVDRDLKRIQRQLARIFVISNPKEISPLRAELVRLVKRRDDLLLNHGAASTGE